MNNLFSVGMSFTIIDHFSNVLYTLQNGLQRTRMTATGFDSAIRSVSTHLGNASGMAAMHSAKLDVERASLNKLSVVTNLQAIKVKELATQYKNIKVRYSENKAAALAKLEVGKAELALMQKQQVMGELRIAQMEQETAAMGRQRAAMGMLAGAAAAFFASRAAYSMLKSTITPGAEFSQQVSTALMAGMTQSEIDQVTRKSFDVTSRMPVFTSSEIMKNIIEARAFGGSTDFALQHIDALSKAKMIMMASTDQRTKEQAETFIQGAVKSAEMLGYIDPAHPEIFDKYIGEMARNIVITRGMLTPSDFQMYAKYAGISAYGRDDHYREQMLPVKMLEWKASGAGGGGGARSSVGNLEFASYRAIVQGIGGIQKNPLLAAMGLLPEGVKDPEHYKGPWKGAEIYTKNPVTWLTEVFIPAVQSSYRKSPEYKKTGKDLTIDQIITEVVPKIFTSKTAMGDIALTLKMIEKGQFGRFENLKNTMPSAETLAKLAEESARIQFEALGKSLENLRIAIGMHVVPVIIPALDKLTHAIGALAKYFAEHPLAAKMIALGLAIAVVVFGLLGLGLALAGLGALFAAGGEVALIIAAVAILTPLAAALSFALGTGLGLAFIRLQLAVERFIFRIMLIISKIPVLGKLTGGAVDWLRDDIGAKQKNWDSMADPFRKFFGLSTSKDKFIGPMPGKGFHTPFASDTVNMGPGGKTLGRKGAGSKTEMNINHLELKISEKDFADPDKAKAFMMMLKDALEESQHTTTAGEGPDESQWVNGAGE